MAGTFIRKQSNLKLQPRTRALPWLKSLAHHPESEIRTNLGKICARLRGPRQPNRQKCRPFEIWSPKSWGATKHHKHPLRSAGRKSEGQLWTTARALLQATLLARQSSPRFRALLETLRLYVPDNPPAPWHSCIPLLRPRALV